VSSQCTATGSAGTGENLLERGLIVDQHVAGRGTHEHLDAAGELGSDAANLLDVGVGRAKIKAVIRVRAARCDRAFFLEPRDLRSRRRRVGHVEKAGHAAADRRQRFRRDRGLVGQSRFAKMHLIVDQARQQVTPVEIDHFRALAAQRAADRLDALAADQHVRLVDPALVHDARVHEQQPFSHGAPARRSRGSARR
jgi:hypothetical protein